MLFPLIVNFKTDSILENFQKKKKKAKRAQLPLICR